MVAETTIGDVAKMCLSEILRIHAECLTPHACWLDLTDADKYRCDTYRRIIGMISERDVSGLTWSQIAGIVNEID